MNQIEVYTDGACFPNPGFGGWAWTTLKGEQNSGFGGEDTTNQRMEIQAVIEAIRSLYKPELNLVIYSDSMYVINSATVWYKNWQVNNWRKNTIKNRDLLEQLIELAVKPNVSFRHVKGHSGNAGNEEADRLAMKASRAPTHVIQDCLRQQRKH